MTTGTDYGYFERIAFQAEGYVLVIDGQHHNLGAVIRALSSDHRRIAMLMPRIKADLAEAQAALDSAETSNGLTSNGNLWRFWAKQAREVADKNAELRAEREAHHANPADFRYWEGRYRDEKAEVERLNDEAAKLADPAAVHFNMLRGTVAKPTVEQIVHLYGADALRAALTEGGSNG